MFLLTSFISLPISLIGSKTPTSLLTLAILTKIVSSFIKFFKSFKSTIPFSSSLTKSTSYPNLCKYEQGPITEECSNSVVIMCFLLLFLKHIPFIARLFASLAPLVYIISFGFTFKISLICLVASFISLLAETPSL